MTTIATPSATAAQAGQGCDLRRGPVRLDPETLLGLSTGFWGHLAKST